MVDYKVPYLKYEGSKTLLYEWSLGYGGNGHMFTDAFLCSMIAFFGVLVITLVYLGQCDRRLLGSQKIQKMFKLVDEDTIIQGLEKNWGDKLTSIDHGEPSVRALNNNGDGAQPTPEVSNDGVGPEQDGIEPLPPAMSPKANTFDSIVKPAPA